ncbi:MAG: T9SS type A sorting domain-containing protein [Bacteroidia bacterium]
MSEQSTQFQVFAYPNPVKDDILKVELSAGEEVNVAVTLKDISGKVVRRDAIFFRPLIGTRKHEMNVNHLPSGVYLLTVSHPRSTSHKKIVISR